jgi:hypothetical protein
MCGMSPIRSYQRSVWAVRPVRSTTSLIVYLSRPSGRRGFGGGPAQLSAPAVLVTLVALVVLVVSVTVMASTLKPSSALQASEYGEKTRGRDVNPLASVRT